MNERPLTKSNERKRKKQIEKPKRWIETEKKKNRKTLKTSPNPRPLIENLVIITYDASLSTSSVKPMNTLDIK